MLQSTILLILKPHTAAVNVGKNNTSILVTDILLEIHALALKASVSNDFKSVFNIVFFSFSFDDFLFIIFEVCYQLRKI